jgi:hypothetical protein
MPLRWRRDEFAARLKADVVVVDPGIETCLERAQSRPNPETTIHLINRWYAKARLGRPR